MTFWYSTDAFGPARTPGNQRYQTATTTTTTTYESDIPSYEMRTRHTSQVASAAQSDIYTMEGYLAEVGSCKGALRGELLNQCNNIRLMISLLVSKPSIVILILSVNYMMLLLLVSMSSNGSKIQHNWVNLSKTLRVWITVLKTEFKLLRIVMQSTPKILI